MNDLKLIVKPTFFIQLTSLKIRLSFYALNSSMKSLAFMNLLMLTSLIFHYTITYIMGLKNARENMCELCGAEFCILSIIAGESSFSTGDNRDSTVDASVIAPVRYPPSIWITGVKFMAHPVLGCIFHECRR